MSGKKGMQWLPSGEGRFRGGTTRRKTYVERMHGLIESLADGAVHTDEDILRVAVIRQFKLANDSKAVATFIRTATITPWISVERSAAGTRFTIDRELKAICEGRAPRSGLGGMPPKAFLENFAAEIYRRRKENEEKKNTRMWQPDSIDKRQQSNLLDWVELQLKKLLAVAESDSQSDEAKSDLNEIREKKDVVCQNGSETGTLDAGTCQGNIHDAGPARRAGVENCPREIS